MSQAQRRAFGGNGFFFLFPPNEKGEAAGTHPKNEAELFTLASTHWLAGFAFVFIFVFICKIELFCPFEVFFLFIFTIYRGC